LVGVRDERTVVDAVGDAVVVVVGVAGVADAVAVGVLLVGVRHRRAIVRPVGHAVAVGVEDGDARAVVRVRAGEELGAVADAVVVGVGVERVRLHRRVHLVAVEAAVAVGVGDRRERAARRRLLTVREAVGVGVGGVRVGTEAVLLEGRQAVA